MRILITGGAGFIGSNLAAYFSQKHQVTVFDSLERKGSEKNWAWLKSLSKERALNFVQGEITDFALVKKLVKKNEAVFHLAAQVAVTSSLKNPRRDFEVNLIGTFNVLEAARLSKIKPLIVFSSTNKVYGKIGKVGKSGISENQPLDFYSPYGCSKGAADCYVRDYGRIYGLATVVLRKSCVYGPRQFGTEDQGWVAHFVRQALRNETVTIYGSGRQVRDLLYIDDLVGLYEKIVSRFQKFAQTDYAAAQRIYAGEVFNVGGGVEKAISLLELIGKLEKILGKKIKVQFVPARPGDQKIYISNISKAKKVFNWQPRMEIDEGLAKLVAWVEALRMQGQPLQKLKYEWKL